jgi:hypothetical protein
MWLFGKFPLLPAEQLDHAPRARAAPPVAATAEYGSYLAQAAPAAMAPTSPASTCRARRPPSRIRRT